MHRLRRSILAGEAAPAPDTREACRRRGEAEPPASERRTAAQRNAERHREIVERGSIEVRGKTALVRVVNVSGGGLTVETSLPVEAGETVRILIPGAAPAEAAVRWTKGGRVGLAVPEGTLPVPE